jgi:hypothetical protein
MNPVTVIAATLMVEALIWGVARFRAALARPSRRARLNLA